jgi:hypothetical protein
LVAILRTAVAIAALIFFFAPARAAEPLKIGFSMAMTGGVAQNGKQLLIALELWRHDINAKGGLLGRPVEFVYYDDQSNPSNVPGIYTKLINIDKVDLLLGPYATNMVAAAMPVIMESNKLTIGMMAVSINRHFNYPKYFSMLSLGPDGVRAFSEGFFALAAAQKPKLQTPNSRALPPTVRGRTLPPAASKLSTTRAIRPARRTSRRPCVRCRRRIPTSSLSPLTRRTRSALCVRRTRSA